MKVKNDFPNVDRVIRKLKAFIKYFKSQEETNKMANSFIGEIDKFIEAIENYLDSVCNDEERIQRFKDRTDDIKQIQEYIQELDNRRTACHSEIIRSMIFIDRIAEKNGLEEPFDYADGFENDSTLLTPTTIEEKRKMSEEARIKRREMGNFGLYIAASVTAGLKMKDREVRSFASCESDDISFNDSQEAREAFEKVKKGVRPKEVTKNMEDMIRD